MQPFADGLVRHRSCHAGDLANGRIPVRDALGATPLGEPLEDDFLKDLLALKISALSTLHEFISVVLVTNLEVVKSVCECFDFFFALTDLAVELITVSLELFTLLGSLNDEVGLSVLTVSFHISRG